MTVYIAGPMSNLPEFNYPAFNDAARRLRAAGLVVANPAEHFAGATDLDYGVYIREGVRAVVHSTEVVVLPGWENSRGARLEVEVARAIGMPVTALADRLTGLEVSGETGANYCPDSSLLNFGAAHLTANDTTAADQ